MFVIITIIIISIKFIIFINTVTITITITIIITIITITLCLADADGQRGKIWVYFFDDDHYDELFLLNGWPTKDDKWHFQPGPLLISSILQAGFESAENLMSGFVEWN